MNENTLQIGETISVKIRKFDPTRDQEPYYIQHEVPYTKEMRVLEALDYIVEEIGDSVAYQWFCGVKKCGGCAMKLNGKPVLACWEPVQHEMVLEPLDNLPLLRDLVIDRSRYEENLVKMVPEMRRGEPYPGFPELITPQEMGHATEMMHCIDCLICLSVCPSYGDEFLFIGPAPLVQLARFALDPRDDGPRAVLAVDRGSIEGCVNCYHCTEYCPAGINILEHAIDPLRKQVINEDLGIVAHHNQVYRDLVLEQGIVNPSTLLLRSKGWKVLGETGFAIRLWLKGRISFGKLIRGLLKLDKLETQEELILLAQNVYVIDDSKVRE